MAEPRKLREIEMRAEAAERAKPSPWSVSAWDQRAPLDLGPHEPTPFGISSGCTMQKDLGHNCEDEDDPCVLVEFGRIHLNDSGKSPNHLDNAKEWELAKFVAYTDPKTVIALCAALRIAVEALDGLDGSEHGTEVTSYARRALAAIARHVEVGTT